MSDKKSAIITILGEMEKFYNKPFNEVQLRIFAKKLMAWHVEDIRAQVEWFYFNHKWRPALSEIIDRMTASGAAQQDAPQNNLLNRLTRFRRTLYQLKNRWYLEGELNAEGFERLARQYEGLGREHMAGHVRKLLAVYQDIQSGEYRAIDYADDLAQNRRAYYEQERAIPVELPKLEAVNV